MLTMKEVIAKKRDKHPLIKEEIDFFVQGVVSQSVTKEQISSLAMAIYLNDLSMEEKINLTLAMKNSGEVLVFNNLDDKPIVDKHSTGGVSDSVSLALAPIVAACGAYLPMITGKGLGHTGGTTDKLNSIKGYNTAPDLDLFRSTVKEIGCAVIGQTSNLAPADKIIYSVRDTTGTVESIPLIASSILSKKLASGISFLVMDVKTGSGAFMPTLEKSNELAENIVNIACGAGVQTTALITDMNEALGRNIGNSLEIIEIIHYLKQDYVDPKLDNITRMLAYEMLTVSSICANDKEAKQLVDKALSSGKAAEIFEKMVFALGGPNNILTDYQNNLSKAKFETPIYLEKEGYVEEINTKELGMLLVHLGGGRKNFDDVLDLSVGLTEVKKIGEEVNKTSPVFIVHHNNQSQLEEVKQRINGIYKVSEDKKTNKYKDIYNKIRG